VRSNTDFRPAPFSRAERYELDEGDFMRTIMVVAMIALSGLATTADANSGPTKLPKGAEAGMWTTTPIPEVSACIARAIGAPAIGNVVTAPNGTRYEVGAPTEKDTIYTTQVSRFGPLASDSADVSIALCA
jgi:hypothetical protein